MEELVKALTIGLTNGLIIALIAIGYTLVYGILELINFAHADVFMLGTAFTFFATTFIVQSMGIDPRSSTALLLTFLALPFVMLACAVINASIERIAYRPLRNAPRLAPLISAIGMSFVLLNVGLILLGPSPRAVPPILPKEDLFGGLIGTQHIFVGAGDGPCLVLAVGARRKGRGIRYPVNELARKYDAGVDVETTVPAEAYAGLADDRPIRCPDDFPAA